ncbi:MAG: flagellar hook protein FlgE [Janthinobacterium lividum]
MLQAMYSGISAIEAQQTSIDVIGNNIANVNTTAYKAGQVTFEDQLSQTIQGASAPSATVGGVNAQQVGLGVKVAAVNTQMAQGGLQSTTTPTDMAIQGNGFFMLGDATGVSYTRDGSFSLDSSGNLVNSSNGAYVLGWKADANGAIDPSKQISTASKLSIPVGGLTAVQPTSSIALGGNLSAESTAYVAAVPASAGPPAVAASPASGTAPYTRTVKVYDSLGEPANVTLSFTRSSASNSWNWSVSGDASAAGTGTITFDSTGKETASTGTITLTPTDGATSTQTITPDFSSVTQIDGTSSAAPTSQNGYAPGTLQSFSVDDTGTISGVFNNGLTRVLGQVALADFPNAAGLERSGSDAFVTTINSGLPTVGQALTSSLGKISTGYLEQSNVDLSSEFTNLIVAQRGFQANTKIVSTVDQLLNDVIQMKQ